MAPKEYSGHVQSAVANRLLADKSIEDEAMRYFFELETRQYEFGRGRLQRRRRRARRCAAPGAGAEDGRGGEGDRPRAAPAARASVSQP